MDNRYAKSFRDLLVYKKARSSAKLIFELTRDFPVDERFSLTDQIRRSSRSIGAQIAEAWAKRRYPKHFISKLTDADGEQLETQHWVEISRESGYISEEEKTHLISELKETGAMLNSMIRKADSFCRTTSGNEDVQEPGTEYFLDSPSN